MIRDNSFERIRALSAHFDFIRLGELNSASLLNRVDSKFWFSVELLPDLMEEILDHYLLLSIKDDAFQFYRTYYFDTPQDGFYLDHHNGRNRRVKVRIREYVNSDLSFLEVKQKLNTGKTCKHRQQIEAPKPLLTQSESTFIGPYIGVPPSELEVKIQNQFQRITLVNRNLRERCTLDMNIQFQDNHRQIRLGDIVVLELKQERRDVPSLLAQTLRNRKLRPRGFSKYCVGRALLEPGLKQNRLKPALQRIRPHTFAEPVDRYFAACG